MHEFLQNSVFSPRSARFVIFVLGATFFSFFQQSVQICTKQCFQPEISTYRHFCTGCTIFLTLFSKVHEFVQNSVFSPRSACFVIFALGTPLLNVFSKVHEFVQNSVFSPTSARFVIFALGATRFSFFSAKCASLYKTVFSARDQHVLSFLHWMHHFLTLFSKVYEFVQNSVFSPRSARTVQKSVFSPRSARFDISARCGPPFNSF